MFKDRQDAAKQLARKLYQFKNKDVVVLAIPRGGLPLGAIVAKSLKSPLDIALSKKIEHPLNKEYAIGAVSLKNSVLTDAFGVTKNYIEEETIRIRKKLRERHKQYYKNRSAVDLTNKTVIIIDDGIATGNTILVTVDLVSKEKPDKIVVAIPVAPISALRKLQESPHVDEVVCLETPYYFRAVGEFYKNFDQVSDKEAIQLLEKTNIVNH